MNQKAAQASNRLARARSRERRRVIGWLWRESDYDIEGKAKLLREALNNRGDAFGL